MNDGLRRPGSHALENLAALQVILFVIGVSWAFGGNADWVRTPVSLWGSLGLLLFIPCALRCGTDRPGPGPTLLWCVPVALLNVLVLVSSLHPGFKTLSYGGEGFFMPLRLPWWEPSSARPEVTLRALWLFDGIYFSTVNLALVVRRRATLRRIMAWCVANALALSVFGTVQKLTGSSGIYFGRIKSPQDYFFASFVYDNHWAAFILLMLGACFGLVLRYIGRAGGAGLLRGPVFAGLLAALLIALTIPLSGARACTLLLVGFTILAIAAGAPTVGHALRASGVPREISALGITIAVLLAAWGSWAIAGNVIQSRVAKAKVQVSEIWAAGGFGARSIVYHDSWRMAHDRLLFGWGMGTYPSVFPLYNTQVARGDHIPVVYHDAHSDWIQSVAEVGLAGTLLIGGAVLLPAWSLRRRSLSPLPRFLLAGCLLVAAYAWVEFPFGNVAVVLAWWTCFFSAVQYARLTDATPAGAA